jgi:hypothetical protein
MRIRETKREGIQAVGGYVHLERCKRGRVYKPETREQHKLTVTDDATCAASLYPPLTLIQKWNSSANNVEKS